MKHLAALAALCWLASAATLAPRKVSYDGYKVFRLSFGDNVDKVNDIISKLSLTTWKGAPRAGATADIVVPPSQLAAFQSEIEGFSAVTMHEDLGASIAEESATFGAYRGM
jgi:hypothetical protein